MDYKKMKCIATDIDGTLVVRNGHVTQTTQVTLKKWMAQGGKLVLVSGRNLEDCRGVIEELELDQYGGYIIGTNGQFIYNCKTEEMVENPKLSIDECQSIITLANKHHLVSVIGIKDQLYNVGTGLTLFITQLYSFARKMQWIYRQVDGHPQTNTTDIRPYLVDGSGKIGFMHMHSSLVRFEKDIHKNYPDTYETYFVASKWLEIVKKGISKGNALKQLCQQIGITPEEVIAFGDGENDLPLLKAAGIAVAMGNAMDSVKKQADVIADTNLNDGLAKIVAENMLNF